MPRRLWTSPQQAQIMVSFIEEHGNLVYIDRPRGRVLLERRWRELAEKLNSCGMGDPRPPVKWKKVWSDFKSNTKRRAAHIRRTTTGTEGEPAGEAGKLTELEERVLAIINQATETSVDVPEREAPVNKREPSSPTSPPRRRRRLSATVLSLDCDTSAGSDTSEPQFEIDFNIPGCSNASAPAELQGDSPPPKRRVVPPARVNLLRRRQLRGRWRQPTAIDRAIMAFVKANREERENRRETERRRELYEEQERQSREEDRQFLREAALRQEQIQRQWMEIVTRALDLLEQLAPPKGPI